MRGRGTVAAGVRGDRGRSGPLRRRAGLGGSSGEGPGVGWARSWMGRESWRVAWAERDW